MLFVSEEFVRYKEEIEKELKLSFSNTYELDEYLKEMAGEQFRGFLTDIVRALNILNEKDKEDGIKQYTEQELVIRINLVDNGNKLLSKKDDEQIARYINKRNQEQFNLIKKLQEMLEKNISDKTILNHKINLVMKEKEKIIIDNKKNNKSFVMYIVLVILFVIIVLIISLNGKEKAPTPSVETKQTINNEEKAPTSSIEKK